MLIASGKRPFFSVVMPVRNRAETLLDALSTVTNQTFDDYELVLGDNCSSDRTHEIAANFHSPRIKYYKTSVALPMNKSWEFALSRAKGRYAIVLGADDALLPTALERFAEYISLSRAALVSTTVAYYFYPGLGKELWGGRLRFPVISRAQMVKGRDVIEDVTFGKATYYGLPMINQSVVAMELLDEIRRRTGAVFHSGIPDVYSGFCLARLAKEYLRVSDPLVVRGTSSLSGGCAWFHGKYGNATVQDEFMRHVGVDDYRRTVVHIKSAYFVAALQFFQMQRLLGQCDTLISPEMLAINTLEDLSVYNKGEWDESIRRLTAYLSVENKLTGAVADIIKNHTPHFVGRKKVFAPGLIFEHFDFDAERFGIHNVTAASEFTEHILDGFYRPAVSQYNVARRKKTPEQVSFFTHEEAVQLFVDELIRTLVNKLRGQYHAILIYGGGLHTKWLLSKTGSTGFAAVVDDAPGHVKGITNLPVISPDQINDMFYDAVLLSSDYIQPVLRKQSEKWVRPDAAIVDIYEGLPSGPWRCAKPTGSEPNRIFNAEPKHAMSCHETKQ